MSFRFNAVHPILYTGFYGRIEGETTVFHIRQHPRKSLPWPMIVVERDGDRGSCWAPESESSRTLTQAVLAGKRFFGGGGGGEFIINEYGEAIVPSPKGDGKRAFVGRVHGSPQFIDPFHDGAIIDLSNDSGLRCGDPSPLPYIGSQYNLAAGGWIYRTCQTSEGLTFPRLQKPCQGLIADLRSVRPYGAARFIVNSCGIILTKRHDGFGWGSVYVGRVDAGAWFNSDLDNELNLAHVGDAGRRTR